RSASASTSPRPSCAAKATTPDGEAPMASPDPPRPSAEALARQLQQSLRQRRFRPTRIVALALIATLAALAGLAWSLFHYRGDGPPLQVLALDGMANETETPRARAVLAVPEGASARLGGHDVIFLDRTPVPRPGAPLRQEKTVTDRQG